MRTKFKAWAEPYILEHPEIDLSWDYFKSFKNKKYLEIGAGKGGFLVKMALKNPDFLFVGVEKNVTCSGITAKKIVEQEVNNAKLIWKNADFVLENFEDNSLDGIFLNFSDPWPKKRHYKRRLTYIKYLLSYYRVLKPGAKLIVKTDQKPLYDFTLEQLKESNFSLINCSEDYKNLETFDEMTEYEESFRNLGQNIYRIVVRK